jgi:hypothetical protein
MDVPVRPSTTRLSSIVRATTTLGVLIVGGCSEPTAPEKPPYLAIVASLTTWPGASAPSVLRYRIRRSDPDSTRPFRTVAASPRDTIILPVAPGVYIVEADSLPSRCVMPRSGPVQSITLSEQDNTGLVRYSIECRTQLAITVVSDGPDADQSFVYRVRGSTGVERVGLLPANDTLSVDDLPAGEYTIDIGGVSPACAVTSDGGARQRTHVAATGGAAVAFRVMCADPAHRPQISGLVSGYDRGATAFSFRVFDPDGDIDRYIWDLTDCEGNSVLPDKRERIRGSLRTGRGNVGRDTLTIVGAWELGLPADSVIGRCTEIRVLDAQSNVSAIVIDRIRPRSTTSAPTARFFNSVLLGQAAIGTTLAVSDPENDIVGHFVLVRLRDGVLGPRDGLPDLGSMDAVGYLGTDVVNIPTTGRIAYDDVLSVIVCLIDARGNVLRLEDDDTFR